MGSPVALLFEPLVLFWRHDQHLRSTSSIETHMALFIRSEMLKEPATFQHKTKRRSGHTRPSSVELLDLSQPGRVRVGHMLTLFGVSHSTLYKRMDEGLCPKADGRDGGRPYWRTETIRQALMN